MTKITKTVLCDLCGKKIEEAPYGGLFGDRFTVTSGILGRLKETVDICYECKNIIRNKRIDEEKKGGAK